MKRFRNELNHCKNKKITFKYIRVVLDHIEYVIKACMLKFNNKKIINILLVLYYHFIVSYKEYITNYDALFPTLTKNIQNTSFVPTENKNTKLCLFIMCIKC